MQENSREASEALASSAFRLLGMQGVGWGGGGVLAEYSFLKVFKMRERHQKSSMREEMEKMKSMCMDGLITRVLGLGCWENAGVLMV